MVRPRAPRHSLPSLTLRAAERTASTPAAATVGVTSAFASTSAPAGRVVAVFARVAGVRLACDFGQWVPFVLSFVKLLQVTE